MQYSYDLTIPEQTTEAGKISLVCPVDYGILRQVEIFFPWGCAGLVHVQLYKEIHQLFPSNRDESYADNDYHLKFEEYYPILSKPYELTAWGWNLDDYFEHTINFKFLVIHPAAISTITGSTITREGLAELLGTYEIGGG